MTTPDKFSEVTSNVTSEDKIKYILQCANSQDKDRFSQRKIDPACKGSSITKLKKGEHVTAQKVDEMYLACLEIANNPLPTVTKQPKQPKKTKAVASIRSKADEPDRVKILEFTTLIKTIESQETTIKDQAAAIRERDKEIKELKATILTLQKKVGIDLESRIQEIKQAKKDGATLRDVTIKYNLHKKPELLEQIRQLFRD